MAFFVHFCLLLRFLVITIVDKFEFIIWNSKINYKYNKVSSKSSKEFKNHTLLSSSVSPIIGLSFLNEDDLVRYTDLLSNGFLWTSVLAVIALLIFLHIIYVNYVDRPIHNITKEHGTTDGKMSLAYILNTESNRRRKIPIEVEVALSKMSSIVIIATNCLQTKLLEKFALGNPNYLFVKCEIWNPHRGFYRIRYGLKVLDNKDINIENNNFTAHLIGVPRLNTEDDTHYLTSNSMPVVSFSNKTYVFPSSKVIKPADINNTN